MLSVLYGSMFIELQCWARQKRQRHSFACTRIRRVCPDLLRSPSTRKRHRGTQDVKQRSKNVNTDAGGHAGLGTRQNTVQCRNATDTGMIKGPQGYTRAKQKSGPWAWCSRWRGDPRSTSPFGAFQNIQQVGLTEVEDRKVNRGLGGDRSIFGGGSRGFRRAIGDSCQCVCK